MSTRLFTNNATTTLAAGISSGAGSLIVTAGTGALFPQPNTLAVPATYFTASLFKNGNNTITEIITVTARTNDTFSILRGAESSGNKAWNAGDFISAELTAGVAAGFAQFDDLQLQAGNFAVDVGSANHYAVTLSPALQQYSQGMPIRFRAANSSTSQTMTLTAGALTFPLLNINGNFLPANAIQTGCLYEVYFQSGGYFGLINPSNMAPLASPVFTGLPTAPTVAISANDLSIANTTAVWQFLDAYATTAALAAAVAPLAPTASPALTGDPTAPTAGLGVSTAQLATTAFVNPGSSILTNGYRKNPDSSIELWGIFTTPASSPGLITLPTPVPNSVFNVQLTPVNFQQAVVWDTTFASTTQIRIIFGSGGQQICWRAIAH